MSAVVSVELHVDQIEVLRQLVKKRIAFLDLTVNDAEIRCLFGPIVDALDLGIERSKGAPEDECQVIASQVGAASPGYSVKVTQFTPPSPVLVQTTHDPNLAAAAAQESAPDVAEAVAELGPSLDEVINEGQEPGPEILTAEDSAKQRTVRDLPDYPERRKRGGRAPISDQQQALLRIAIEQGMSDSDCAAVAGVSLWTANKYRHEWGYPLASAIRERLNPTPEPAPASEEPQSSTQIDGQSFQVSIKALMQVLRCEGFEGVRSDVQDEVGLTNSEWDAICARFHNDILLLRGSNVTPKVAAEQAAACQARLEPQAVNGWLTIPLPGVAA